MGKQAAKKAAKKAATKQAKPAVATTPRAKPDAATYEGKPIADTSGSDTPLAEVSGFASADPLGSPAPFQAAPDTPSEALPHTNLAAVTIHPAAEKLEPPSAVESAAAPVPITPLNVSPLEPAVATVPLPEDFDDEELKREAEAEKEEQERELTPIERAADQIAEASTYQTQHGSPGADHTPPKYVLPEPPELR